MNEKDDAMALTLPSELKNCIATFCNRRSLASLALVHTSYQLDAERALYHTLVIFADSKCLDTLSAHPQKAAMVRSLHIASTRARQMDAIRMRQIVDALSHMRSLSDLRMNLWNPVVEYYDFDFDGRINGILRGHHFELHTLYCRDIFDIPGIINGQPELQILGIYSWDGTLLDTLRSLAADDLLSKLPIVFTLDPWSFQPFYDHLGVFPAFYPHRSAICRAFATSFEQKIRGYISTKKAKVSQFSIYLRNFSDMALFRNIMEDMVMHFPHVSWLNLRIENPNHVPYSEFAKILSVVTELTTFLLWNKRAKHHDGLGTLSEDRKMALAREWTDACPDLFQITFFDGVSLARSDDDSWRVFGR